MIVMFLGGLWHGAAWSYAVWGSFHGLALAVERFIENHVKVKQTRALLILKGLMVFGFVTFAWLLFKLPHFQDAVYYMIAMFRNKGHRDMKIIFYTLLYSLPVVLYHFHYLYKTYVAKSPAVYGRFQPFLYAILLFGIIVNSGSPGEFIYFQF
jgi:alginate O-acetyltransferase complex protein AlgI